MSEQILTITSNSSQLFNLEVVQGDPATITDIIQFIPITSDNTNVTGKEDKSNKVSSFQATPDDIHYPSEKLVKDSLDGKADSLGANDNYITDSEKAALHSHTNKTALDNVSGVNTGDQDLSGYSLINHNHSGTYAPALGADDNYITDAEKSALHSHSNKVALDAVAGTNTGDQDLSELVPYSGAEGDADMGSYAVKAAKFQLKTDAVNIPVTGDIYWNEHAKTANIKSGNVTLQINQEQVLPVKNITGSTLLNGRLVRITGHDEVTEYYTIEYSSNTSEATSFVDFMLTEDIATGEVGLGTKTGLVHDINTSTGSLSAPVFLGVDGQFTFTQPSYPDRTVLVGICGHIDALVGEVFVDLARSTQYNINTLDAELDLKATQNPGICQMCPILPIDIVIDTTTRVLTIATVKGGQAITPASPVRFFTDGDGIIHKWEKTSAVTFPAFTDTTGVWYFYFDNTGAAITTQTAWSDFNVIAAVYRLYWNATLTGSAKLVVESYECHLNDTSAADHAWKHAQGSIYERGLSITTNALASGAPNADGRNTVIALSTGTCSDDGLEWTVTNVTNPVNYFEQNLGNIVSGTLNATNSALFKIRTNDTGGLLNFLPATRFPFKWNTSNNRPQYINTLGTAVDVPDDQFFVYYVYNLSDRVPGNAIKLVSAPITFATQADALAYSWESLRAIYPTINDNEIRPLYKLIFLVNHTVPNPYDVGCKYTVLRQAVDIRKQVAAAIGAAAGSTNATSVVVSPTGNISSTNVQSALAELDSEKQPVGNYSTDIHSNITALNLVSGENTGDQDLSGKQDLLESGVNIKTINNTSILGSGNITIEGGSGGGITNILYTDLTALISTDSLVAGSYYNIIDFATSFYIIDGNSVKYDLEPQYGENEPLIVLATSVNTLDKEVKSLSHPEDIIYYDWNPVNWLDDFSFADAEDTKSIIIPDFKGVIYFRHDLILNNSCGYDFRNVKYRRWKVVAPAYNIETTYNVGDMVQFTTGGNIYISILPDNLGNDVYSGFWNLICDVTPSEYLNFQSSTDYFESGVEYADFLTFASTDPGFTYETSVRNTHLKPFRDTYSEWKSCGTILSNNVIHLPNTTVLNQPVTICVYNNTIGALSSFNTINGVSFYGNTFGESFNWNIIGSTFNSNRIGFGFYGNITGTNFFGNTIGNGFATNHITNNFYSNICYDGFVGCNIKANFQWNIGVFWFDLMSATHVYQTKTCTTFYNGNAELKLSFYDENSILTITQPDE